MKHIKCIITVLCCSVLLLLTSCGGNSDQLDTDIIHNPNSASGYDAGEKMPQIAFDEDMHDFGRLSAGENVSYSFKFVNKGNADLVISGCDASCGCTVADYPKDRIKPGEGGYVTISFKSAGMSGQQFKDVVVSTNGQPASTKLRIHAEVR